MSRLDPVWCSSSLSELIDPGARPCVHSSSLPQESGPSGSNTGSPAVGPELLRNGTLPPRQDAPDTAIGTTRCRAHVLSPLPSCRLSVLPRLGLDPGVTPDGEYLPYPSLGILTMSSTLDRVVPRARCSGILSSSAPNSRARLSPHDSSLTSRVLRAVRKNTEVISTEASKPVEPLRRILSEAPKAAGCQPVDRPQALLQAGLVATTLLLRRFRSLSMTCRT